MLPTAAVPVSRPCVAMHAKQQQPFQRAKLGASSSGLRTRQTHAYKAHPATSSRSRFLASRVVASAAVDASLADAESLPILQDDGTPTTFPNAPGVYGVYDADNKLQYVGISRRIALSVATHVDELPELTRSVRFSVVSNPTKEALTGAWKEWVQEAVNESGTIPPGNMPGEKLWVARKGTAPRPEIRLTPGKGLQDLTCSVEDLIEQVVKNNKVVAFVKGTRTEPQCGFSHKVLTLLTQSRAQFEVVNVLDEQYNPGLREAIKAYSQWPTIPQLYIEGEFVGGADIVEEMFNSGELQQAVKGTK